MQQRIAWRRCSRLAFLPFLPFPVFATSLAA